ncbi:MAG: hypothetical protein ABW321_31345, partial [Polyangiales bacterium]
MSPRPARAPLNILCVLMLADAGCRVYDTDLVEGARQLPSIDGQVVQTGTAAAVSGSETEQTEAPPPAVCGNGIVDDIEHCDIAIPRGQPGACPESCSGHDGCFKQTLAGQRCGAHCEEVEVTDVHDDDDCCPMQASLQTDNDCSATCGNGMLEAGERCDPSDSCPTQETCPPESDVACMTQRYTGSPALCSARCDLHKIDSCTHGDGCCPTGCKPDDDDDCTEPTTVARGTPAPRGDAGTPDSCEGEMCPGSAEPDGEPLACSSEHAGGRCEACDCAYCSNEALACLTGPRVNANAQCAALLTCATERHCSGIDCYCGTSDLASCQTLPLGPCAEEIRNVAGSRQLLMLYAEAANTETPLGRAA